jgi:hypothetical protein
MLIDGEKWACEACVRGHRVSSCHHSDRPLTHINKKGRPVSQCAHCRGLRKSRTTHTKCECGDKKKNCHKNDSDLHTADRRDHKQDSRQRCGCCHGQRCICALKKEHHLDPVPETGLPPAQPTILSECPKKPQLTSTKSESTLTVFRDGHHHKPHHKHNDMAHKCGLPYTIPRSHTFHAPSEVTRRSVDHLPLSQSAMMGENLPYHQTDQQQQPPPPPSFFGPPRRTKSEHGSPESAPVSAAEDLTTSVPSLDISPFFPPPAASASQQSPLEQSNEAGSEQPTTITETDEFGKTPLNQIVTSVPPADMFPGFSTSTTSPVSGIAFQDPYQEPFFASPDAEMPVGTAGFNAPSVDWSSFPLYSSDAPAPTSTQAPSYASFDYNSIGPNFAAPSSSGDISEADEFGPLPGLAHTGSDLHSVSEGSDMDHLRLSSASSFISMPQAQLLASNNLDSISIDDFLKSANESTAALEHQLQTNIGIEQKPFPDSFATSQPPTYSEGNGKSVTADPNMVIPTTSPTDPTWPTALFESGPSMEDPFYPQTWTQ